MFLLVWLASLGCAQAAPDALSKALEAVKMGTPECEKCLFFGVPIQNEPANQIIQQHQLFSVSTLDLVPSPIWTVALSPSKKAFLLEARDLDGWNEMMRGEKLKLSGEKEWTLFARVFLRLNSPRSLYIPLLTQAEEKKLGKDDRKIHRKGVRVIQAKGRVGLAFYAKNVTGGLERWTLLLENNGQILKAENKVFR